jgi:16S rRNA (guanine527-N7)-methyltransferase
VLPTEVDGLPPLGRAFDEVLDAALDAMELPLSSGARAAVDAHARLLLAWTASINLTAVRSPDAVAREHVADSLAAVALIRRLADDARGLLDLGSGGGYPGLPLAVALPALRCALVESVAKKARFLSVAADAATRAMASAGERPPAFSVLATRAEALANGPERERWDVVTARALAGLAELAELALPLARIGGCLVAWKRDDGSGRHARELDAATDHVAAVGGAIRDIEPVTVAGLGDHRLVVIRKVRATPDAFPRTPAERRRQWPGSERTRC